MLQIKLKARHLRLIVYLLQNMIAKDILRVLNEIINKVPDTALDTDDIEVNTTAEEVKMIYPKLSALSEGAVAEINKEMDYMLFPQIQAGLASGTPEPWQDIMDCVTSHKGRMAQMTQGWIDEGKRTIADSALAAS